MTAAGAALRDLADAVPEAVLERLLGSRAILAVAHENPDADTLGATLGVARIAATAGAHVTTVCADRPPPAYVVLPGIEGFRMDPEPAVDYDLLVISDAGPLERTGAVFERHRDLMLGLPRVTIDHHASSEAHTPADWIDASYAATCEMVALLAARAGVPLDLDAGGFATTLLAGIVTDTATFAHPNATPRTLRIAAVLMEAGGQLSELSRHFYRTKPIAQLRLFGRVLDRLQSALEGVVIWSTLLDEDLLASGAAPADSEGLVDLLAQAETAEVALLFTQTGAMTRVSVRTKPGGVDATELTGRFGGGGHARAAGATIGHPFEAAIPLVTAEAERLAALVRR